MRRLVPNPARRALSGLLPWLLCALLLGWQPAGGQVEPIALPEIGDPSGNLLSPTEERRLGQAFMRSVRSTQRVIADPLLDAYIQRLGQQLVAHTENPGRHFNFFLIDDPTVNAFAGPGGNIGVYSGLITTSQSESELASVLAHEIAHVTQNHLVRTYDAVQRMTLPLAAVALAAVALGAATDNPSIGLAGVAGMQAGVAQTQINFTRAHEEEADRLGIRTLAHAGYEPAAMAGFFGRLGRSSRLYDGGTLPEFLRTHPVTPNRIADAHGRASEYPYRQQPDSLDYHLVRATLKAGEFADPAQAVIHFHDTLQEKRYRNQEAQRYGYVLALQRAKRYAEAQEQLRPLLLERPDKVAYLVLQAQLLQARQQPAEALQVLRDGLTLYPGDYVLTLYYTNMLLVQQQPAEALRLIEQQLKGRPQDQQILKLASQAAAALGREALSHQYLAEHYYQSGAVEAAAQQLQIALQDPELDYYQSAQMSARLREFRQEIGDLKARK